MSTEPIAELDFEALGTDGLKKAIVSLENDESALPLLIINIPLANWSNEDYWNRVTEVLMDVRAANISTILLLKKTDVFLEDDEVLRVFEFLRNWDQFLLHNFLRVCEDWVPNTYQPLLQTEAKVELKWFKEWLAAASDTRLHKYPGLPWRSYVRKIVGENYAFALRFFELTANAATPENIKLVQAHFLEFLEAKKKVVCMFPKKLNRGQA